MGSRVSKRLIGILLCIIIIFSVFSPIYAVSIPSAYSKYVVDGRVDYADLHYNYFRTTYWVDAPTAQYKVTVKRNGSKVSEGISESGEILYAQIGDELIIENISTLGSGTGWNKCDFQVSTDGNTIATIKTITGMESYKISTTKEAIYNLSLCIMDNDDKDNNLESTEGWGNWSYNGLRVPGTNPGAGTGSDFPGWWYYAKLTVIVKTPEYKVEEKHIVSDTGTVLDATTHDGITSSSFTTYAQSFDGYDFIGSRAGYTWNEIANGTTENISKRTASFDSTHMIAFHYYYYKKTAPPPPPTDGKASIVVYYKDKVSGAAVHPADETTYKDVDYGTYTIAALSAPEGYTFDTVTTPSPQTVTVNATNNYKEVTFYYQPENAPALKSPVAILTGPEQVMAGDDFRVDASNSYATEPGASLKQYLWDINRYTATYPPIEDTDNKLTLWSDIIEGDSCGIDLTVVDSNGMTDDARIRIEVLPAEPTPVITVTGDLRENRKVTLSSASSKAPKHFPIDTTKTKWEITPVSGGTATDIKYSGLLVGTATKDILFKKAGVYKVKLYVELAVGVVRTTEMNITIKPDLPPIADFSTPPSIYRDPADSNNAKAIITNLSTSPDGDIIWKSACLAVYDSDNDGVFDEETCYYCVNGTTWVTTGKTYAQIKTNGFDIFSLATTNPDTFIYKSKEVGKYMLDMIVVENIPTTSTIPEFISNSDYRRSNTWK